jgi:hypothetical protein
MIRPSAAAKQLGPSVLCAPDKGMIVAVGAHPADGGARALLSEVRALAPSAGPCHRWRVSLVSQGQEREEQS